MLDLNHPFSNHIFHAAHLLDRLLPRGQQMTVSSSADRINLLDECLPLLEEMRQLNAERFGKSAFIAGAIDEFECGLRALAASGGRQLTEGRDGSGDCPVCGTATTHLRQYQIMVCGKCDELFMPAKEKLCGPDGFRIDSI